MFNRQKVRVAPALLIIALALLATLAPAKPARALGAPVLSKSGGVYSSYSQWTWNESVSWTSVPGAQSYNCKLGYPTGHVETISYCTPALVTAADGL
ncbi:MAG: hypothetical protein KDD83_28715, partial [Caldilineaceae bacterium]|nr:hypothetical protein [Caldilineaceae bacterium]